MTEGIPQETGTDESLMGRYLSGDEKAFELVYRRHREGVRRFFARQCGSQAVAQELAQEVWFKVIRAVQNQNYTADGRFTTYLYRVARNQLIDWYRKTGSYQEVEIDETTEETSEIIDFERPTIRNPEELYDDQQKVKAVLEAIQDLPEAPAHDADDVFGK